MKHIIIIIWSLFLLSCKNKDIESGNNELNYKAHIFYYNWFGNMEFDGQYRHWSHEVLPHWTDTTWNNLPPFSGGENIGANFFPQLGSYSCNDKKIIKQHMKMINSAGVGVLCLSWWGENSFEDKTVSLILDEAYKEGVKVNFHIEPIALRTAVSTVKMMKYIIDSYGSHPAFYYLDGKPMFYVYDSYLISKEEWADVLKQESRNSIRGTEYDAFVIGLWVGKGEEDFFLKSGFDGFYTYFASDGFTFGSSSKNWKYLSDWANKNKKIFIPCVGPGYSDTRIRPWNAENYKSRQQGKYYDNMFEAAILSGPNFIGITSFNEWHEGTQIEPAIVNQTPGFKYENYYPLKPDYYLHSTRNWTNKFD